LSEAQTVCKNKKNSDKTKHIKIETVFLNKGETLKQIVKKMVLDGNDPKNSGFRLGGSGSENPKHNTL
jgi:hypothetical protein